MVTMSQKDGIVHLSHVRRLALVRIIFLSLLRPVTGGHFSGILFCRTHQCLFFLYFLSITILVVSGFRVLGFFYVRAAYRFSAQVVSVLKVWNTQGTQKVIQFCVLHVFLLFLIFQSVIVNLELCRYLYILKTK